MFSWQRKYCAEDIIVDGFYRLSLGGLLICYLGCYRKTGRGRSVLIECKCTIIALSGAAKGRSSYVTPRANHNDVRI